jgi:hypothetical protein
MIFLHYYDLRPNIQLKENADPIWPFGYMINGKISCCSIKTILQDLTKNVQGEDLIEFDLTNDFLKGAALTGIKTIYDFLSVLNFAFDYNFYEENGKLKITNRKITESIDFEKYQDELISYNDYNIDYCDSFSGENGAEINLHLPIIMNKAIAGQIAQRIYQKYQANLCNYEYNLPVQLNSLFSFNKYIKLKKNFTIKEMKIKPNGEFQIKCY